MLRRKEWRFNFADLNGCFSDIIEAENRGSLDPFPPETLPMKIPATVAVAIILFGLSATGFAQTTVAELNGSSSLSTFGAFSDAGAVDVSSGDIEIDVSGFGGYTFNNGQFATRELNKVKTVIDAAIANDVYVIVD
jgi:hypothetical protein